MIHIISNYYVSVENGSYTLFQLVEGKTKKGEPAEHRKVIGYYGSLRQCLRRCASELLEDEVAGRIVELKEAINIINENTMKLEKVFEREGLNA